MFSDQFGIGLAWLNGIERDAGRQRREKADRAHPPSGDRLWTLWPTLRRNFYQSAPSADVPSRSPLRVCYSAARQVTL